MNEMENVEDENLHLIKTDDREYTIKSQVIAPIITQGDPIGAVLIVSERTGREAGGTGGQAGRNRSRIPGQANGAVAGLIA